MKQQVDTPRKGSWAEQKQTRPKPFTPSLHSTFYEADILILSQQIHPCYLSPKDADYGYTRAKSLLTKV